MDALLRADLRRRAGGYCEVGGEPLHGRYAAHHRLMRSHGGLNTLENLLVVCHGHHNLATRSIHLQPALSVACGWIVPQWGFPEEVPIRLHARAMWDDRISIDSLMDYPGPWYLIRGTEYLHTDVPPTGRGSMKGENDGEQ